VHPSDADRAAHVTDAVRPALATLADRLDVAEWTRAGIASAIKETLAAHGLKMPTLAHAARVLICGRAQTPSLDAVLEPFERSIVGARLRRG
jgi:glutamyl-tRNA synthetase